MTWATFYLICFVVGFALSVFMLVGGLGRMHFSGKWHLPHWGHGGFQHGGLGHMPTRIGGMPRGPLIHAGHAAHMPHAAAAGARGGLAKGPAQASVFDFSTLMAFLAWFGGTGYLLTRYSSLWSVLAFGIAVVGGLVGAAVVFWFLVKVLIANETVLDPSDFDMPGVLAKVSNAIRPGGTGEIVFSQAGARRPSGARSENGLAIPKGCEVMVTRYEKGIAYVRRWDEMSQDEFGEPQSKQGEAESSVGQKRTG
jgi:hypothetical protein